MTTPLPSTASSSFSPQVEPYELGYSEGRSSRDADYDATLDDTGFDKEASPGNVAAYIRTLEKEHRAMREGYAETLEAFDYVASALADMGQGVPSFDFEKHKKILSSLTIK